MNDEKKDIDLLIPAMVQNWIRTMLNPKSHISERHAMRNNIADLRDILNDSIKKFEDSMYLPRSKK